MDGRMALPLNRIGRGEFVRIARVAAVAVAMAMAVVVVAVVTQVIAS
jgi:hypothetical protein